MKQGIDFILHHAALLFVILAMAAGMFANLNTPEQYERARAGESA